jgi:transmembrane sensor
MNSTTDSIYSIIFKSLTQELEVTEVLELSQWKSLSSGNLREYNDIVLIWEQSASMKLPSSIDEIKAMETIRSKSRIYSTKKKWITWAIQVAAIITLSVLFSGLNSYFNKATDNQFVSGKVEPVYHEIRAAFGTQAKVELADGTIVFLNSGSKLRFPNTFENLDIRSVALNGEGFFKVSKNEKVPFVVHTDKLDIQVLGTTFNVDAYDGISSVNVALVEGQVKLKNNSGKGSKDLMDLLPNQLASLNLSDHTLVKTYVADLHKYTAWVNGQIVFFGDPIQTVVKKLELWYNVDIVIADKRLEKYRFTGTFIDESLEQILNILSMTSPMTYSIKPSVKQADNSMSKRIIILKSRN